MCKKGDNNGRNNECSWHLFVSYDTYNIKLDMHMVILFNGDKTLQQSHPLHCMLPAFYLHKN